MRLGIVSSVVIAGVAVSLSAQAPEGWNVRVDRSQSAQDPDDRPDLAFMSMGGGLHVVGGPAGTFWKPDTRATGNFTLKGTFVLNKPSSHTSYYGLVVGGSELEGAAQSYLYFVVAQNGTYLIRQRTGDAVSDVQARVAHDAVQRPDNAGRSSNALEVRVAGDTVTFVINGTMVHTAPKSSVKTDGLAGFRVNHQLDVLVQGFEVSGS
jgi:plastocyanin